MNTHMLLDQKHILSPRMYPDSRRSEHTLRSDPKIGSYKVPTMRDVAAAADVSLSTVSLVVNGKPGVSQDRRERVLQAIKELNYQTGRRKKSAVETKIIGLLMESLSEASRSEGF